MARRRRKSQSRAAKLERCVLRVKRSGKGKVSAFKICNASIAPSRRRRRRR